MDNWISCRLFFVLGVWLWEPMVVVRIVRIRKSYYQSGGWTESQVYYQSGPDWYRILLSVRPLIRRYRIPAAGLSAKSIISPAMFTY